MARTARCECGQLAVTVADTPRAVGVCHCLACQRRTGSVFAALAAFSGPWQVTGTATDYVRRGDGGARFRFCFCPVCGTTLFHTEEGRAGSISVAIGSFGDPLFPAPTVSVYECRRHAWVELPADVERHMRDPD